jgi:O-methyltransferase involved in polyketide biosynthesis
MSDLSITALYTSQVWAWGQLPCAELFASRDGKRVFDVTNAALGVMRRGTPLRYALLHRHAMIDHLVATWQPRRIVELAAGLSRRGATLSADPTLHYVEVDLPDVIAHKRRLLERTDTGRAVLARSNYELIAGDVAAFELPACDVVIAEGLAMYLDASARRGLVAKVAEIAGVRFVFDLTPADEEPHAGLTGRVLGAAMKRFTNGRTFERDARTRDDVLGELRAAGFADARAIAATDVAAAWSLPHAERVTPTVVFTAGGGASQAIRS